MNEIGLKGKLDLRQVSDVVCGTGSAREGNAKLQVHLMSPAGTLSLEVSDIPPFKTC
jgi:hypothetical protein